MVETLLARSIDLAELGTRTAQFARSSRSAATERAYRGDWADFLSWCERAGESVGSAAGHTAIQPSIGVGRGFDNKCYRGHQGWPESGSLPRFLGVF